MYVIELLSTCVAFLAEHVRLVVEPCGSETVVSAQPVGNDHGSRFNVVLDERASGFRIDRITREEQLRSPCHADHAWQQPCAPISWHQANLDERLDERGRARGEH